MLLDIYDAFLDDKRSANGGVLLTDGDFQTMSNELNHRPLSVASSSSSAIDSISSTSSSSSLSSSSISTDHRVHRRSHHRSRCYQQVTNEAEEEEEEDCSRSSSGVSEGSARGSWYQGSQGGTITTTSLIRPKYCTDPNLTYTERVATEIVETERTYVNDLQEIIEGYLNYLKTGCFKVEIGSQNITDLFGNIEDIWRFNKEYLKELEQCAYNPASVAKCFVQHKAGFSVYTLYCTNYPRTVSVLTELMRKEETAEIFKVRQAALGHMLPLGSFLLKPVQRILKYHLLLQNMCKHYNKEKGGYENVVEALATMTGIAHHINEMKRKHEHAVRVQEIQSLLYGWRGDDLTTYGELIAEGTFRVFGAKGVRHVFLFEKMLLISKKREDVSLSYKAHIMCSNLMLIESVAGEPLCFHVVPFDSPRVQYTLQARNIDQKREWSLQLKRVILENYNVAIPSHARELVMQLGQSKTDDYVHVERGTVGKRAHSAPEYLERRKQEKERRKIDTFSKSLRVRRGSHLKNKVLGSNEDWREFERKSLSFTRKGKKGKGWRRKSEPCEVISSQESLSYSTKADESITLNSPSIEEVGSTDEYVSFYLPSSRDGIESLPTSPTQVIYDVPTCMERSCSAINTLPNQNNQTSTPLSHYDNLQNLCNCSLSLQSPISPSPSLNLNLTENSDKSSPTEPAVWLKQQQEHLAGGKALKAGSLPRSFQLNNDSSSPGGSFCSINSFIKQRHLVDRPFTIASDKPSQSDLNLEDFERYMVDSPPVKQQHYRFPVDKDVEEEDDEVGGTVSTEDLSSNSSFVLPEHRIYRPSLSRSSLRSLVANLGSRLTGTKTSSNDDQEEKSASRLMVTLVQAYSKMTKRTTRSSKSTTTTACVEEPTKPVVIHRQGSPSIGARMARPLTHQVDYAVPRIRRSSCETNGSSRPESLLSLATSPHWTIKSFTDWESHSNSNQTSAVEEKDQDVEEEEDLEEEQIEIHQQSNLILVTEEEEEVNILNNGSKTSPALSSMADSYYERSFEAIDTLSDSAEVCSDEAEEDRVSSDEQKNIEQLEMQSKEIQSPLRVKGPSILETMKHLEECCKKYQSSNRYQVAGLKPIRERCRVLEERSISLPSSPTSPTVSIVPGETEANAPLVTAGWVKQVVEKFQKDQ
ncbi:hypothetical protein CHUAL_002825 [Chamberlinius hualienensis]